jgi:hypothetical protein
MPHVPPPIPTKLLPLCLLGVMCFFIGCQSTGRIEPSRTSRAEARDRLIQPAALLEFSDQVAMDVVQQLNQMPRVRDAREPVTVILGDIDNRTNVVNTADFELVTSRVRNQLVNSRVSRDRLRFVENRARLERIAQREAVVNVDGTIAGPPAYDARNTFYLNMDAIRVGRANTSLYYMEAQLVSASDNSIVGSFSTDVHQIND